MAAPLNLYIISGETIELRGIYGVLEMGGRGRGGSVWGWGEIKVRSWVGRENHCLPPTALHIQGDASSWCCFPSEGTQSGEVHSIPQKLCGAWSPIPHLKVRTPM